MTIGTALLGFAVVAGLLTVIPGLDTALVVRASITRGRRDAALTALGIASGCLVWGAASAVGVSALLAASELAYRLLTYAGVAYLLYLGVSMIVRSFRHRGRVADEIAAAPVRRGVRAWANGLLVNLLNPKIGVFYVATIPQFIPPGASPLGMGLLLAGLHDAIGLIWFAVLIAASGFARHWLSRSTRIIDRITGGVLILLGLKIALQQRG